MGFEWKDELKYRIAVSIGVVFQGICEEIFSLAIPDFQAVKAAGSHGDLKNDGYCYHSGTYFAAYAPERYELGKTKKKIHKDAEGALRNWPNLKKWVFVTRDELSADAHQAIDELRQKHPTVTFENWWDQTLINLVAEISAERRASLLRHARPTLEGQEADLGFVKEIIDLALSRVDALSVRPRDRRFVDITEKIALNCPDEDEAEYMHEQMLDAYMQFDLIGEVFSSRTTYEQAAVHSEIRERYNRLKSECKATREILHGLVDWYTPNGRSRDTRFTHMVRCFVLFFFEDCTWGKKHKNDKEAL